MALSGPPSKGRQDDEGIYAQLLEQASDLNDELCRENSDLRRAVAELRQRQLQRMKRVAEGSRSAKVRRLMPRAMSNIRSALKSLAAESHISEGLPSLAEEAANRVFASMAELQEGITAFTSQEETAALIAEKVALKEFCIHQQERISELESAKEKLQANSSNWTLRLTSALLPTSEAALVPPKHSAPLVRVGEECEVIGRKGAILRETEDLQSTLVTTVPPGGHVRIIQATQSRRALVEVLDAPEANDASERCMPGSVGWLSVSTKDGKALLRPERKATSEDLLEREGTRRRGSSQDLEKPGEPKAEAAEPALDVEGASKEEVKEENAVEVFEGKEAKAAQAPQAQDVSEAELPANFSESQEALQLGNTPSPGGSVTVSTEAWVALREERDQRDKQIKAMQAQVDLARKQLEQLEEVKAKLREHRSAALEARQRGQESFETLRMASEELRALPEAPRLPEADPEPSEVHASSPEEGIDEDAVEWRRLLSERETTAWELASTLRKVEEMEKQVEDQRIELDIVQRRRERERSSLLMALRELGSWREGLKADEVLDEETSDGPSSRTERWSARASESSPSGHPTGQKGRDEDKERQYLQRISELEETACKLQEQIEAVQARVALLNQQAVTRQQALRYASSLPTVGHLAEAITARTSRPDLDGLTEMLGRLFVENFDLRRKRRAQGSRSVEPREAQGTALDLSRFAVPEGAESDDDCLVPTVAEIAVPLRPESPSPSETLERPCASPRSLLLSFDFNAGVAE